MLELSRIQEAMPPKYEPMFYRHIVLRNLARTRVMSLLVLVFELGLLGMSYIPAASTMYGEHIITYRSLYYIAIVLALVHQIVTLVARDTLKQKLHITELFLQVEAVALILWSALLSLVDQTRGLPGSVYVFIVVTIGVIMIIRPNKAIWVYGISHGIYLMLNIVLNLSDEMIFSNVINTTSIIVTSYIGSVIIYNTYCREYGKQMIIKEQKEALETLVLMDPMTDLYNRRGLENYLEKLGREDDSMKLGVMMVDIDNFKGYNDLYGHILGDEALIKVAQVIKGMLTDQQGIACRYGGDEFCIILNNSDEKKLEAIATSIQEKIRQLNIEHDGDKRNRRLHVTTGSYFRVYDQHTPWQLVDMADKVLYEHKKTRKGA